MKIILPVFVAFLMLVPLFPQDIQANSPPLKPTITGPTDGSTGSTYEYTATTTDPDGDQIFYCFDWGDGNEYCTPMVNSGESVRTSHTWASDGTYTVTVTATDSNQATSEPATLRVTMPASFSAEPIEITKPKVGLYLFGIRVLPFILPLVVGDVTVTVDTDETIEKVEFLLWESCGCGRAVMYTDTTPPFEWRWDTDYDDNQVKDEGFIELTVRGYSQTEMYSDSIGLIKVGL